MVANVELDQAGAPKPGELPPVEYVRLADILIEAIPSDRKQIWTSKVMVYLASQTKRSAAQGKGVPRLPTKAIHADLGGNPNQEPSAWLSSIWKDIESRHYPEIEARVIDLCRQAGLHVYPVLEKDNGKPAFYRLGARALPPSACAVIEDNDELPPNVIRYKPDLSLGLSWLGKLFFNRGLKWTPFKRYSFLSWQILFLISVLVFDFLLWLILWYTTSEFLSSKQYSSLMELMDHYDSVIALHGGDQQSKNKTHLLARTMGGRFTGGVLHLPP